MAIFIAIFLTIFFVIKLFGLFGIEEIKIWFEAFKSQPSYLLGGLVIILLFIDLFLSIPTMATVLLSGYFLGFWVGLLSALLGLALASFTGYFLSRRYGERGLSLITKDKREIREMQESFERHGMSMIILSRAVPMLPEISSALAGLTQMPLKNFLMAWLISSLPYSIILSYAGSVSDIENPKPAIIAIGSFTFLLWVSWAIFLKKKI